MTPEMPVCPSCGGWPNHPIEGDSMCLRSVVAKLRAALRERDAAWRAAIVEADGSCVHVTVAADIPCCSGCRPLRALLGEAGK